MVILGRILGRIQNKIAFYQLFFSICKQKNHILKNCFTNIIRKHDSILIIIRIFQSSLWVCQTYNMPRIIDNEQGNDILLFRHK